MQTDFNEKNRDLISIWHSDPENLTDEDMGMLCQLLDQGEQQRFNKLKSASFQRQYLLAHALLRLNLYFRFEIHPASWKLRYSELNKPYISFKEIKDIDLSITHTKGCAACAVSGSGMIGLDIEPVNRTINYSSLAKRCLTSREQETIEKNSSEKKDVLFLKAWILKEAYLKAIGTGIRRSLKDVEFDLTSDHSRLINGSSEENTRCDFSVFNIGTTHLAAVAAENKGLKKTELLVKNVPVRSLLQMLQSINIKELPVN